MYKEFEEFLDQQHAKLGLPTVNFEQRKEDWLAALNTLYAKIQGILRPYLTDQKIYFAQSVSYITETPLGRYPVPQATIVFGGDGYSQVTLDPLGTFVVGARGRVDMTGPSGKTVKLLLVKKSEIRANTFSKDISPEPESEPEWVWKVVAPSPERLFLEFTESNFLDALMFVMDR